MGRTLGDYESAFGQVSDSVLSRAFNTKAEARHLVAVANSAVRKARDAFNVEITQTWKEGFKALKAENDQMQNDLSQAYKSEIQMIGERFGDMVEGLQK